MGVGGILASVGLCVYIAANFDTSMGPIRWVGEVRLKVQQVEYESAVSRCNSFIDI